MDTASSQGQSPGSEEHTTAVLLGGVAFFPLNSTGSKLSLEHILLSGSFPALKPHCLLPSLSFELFNILLQIWSRNLY